MKFGKLPSIANIDFSLPAFPESTNHFLKQKDVLSKQHAFIGCTGWSMKEWVGKVYPKGTKSKDYLKYYSRQFNTIELNTTHYRIPDMATIEKWYKESADDFRFCPKLPQSISHSANLGLTNDLIHQFCNSVSGLKEKLGCCFMQLPPYFGINKYIVLEKFIQQFPAHIPLAVEFRHESWFTDKVVFEKMMQLFEDHRISTVITDVAGRRDVLHQRLTTDTAMIRFVGNDLHPTDFTRIDAWIDLLIDRWQKGLQTVYFFTHEPENLNAPQLAEYMTTQLRAKSDVIVKIPKWHDTHNPQMSLF